jgi:hypothetical protein
MARLAAAMAGTQDALQEVQRSNQMLERLAATALRANDHETSESEEFSLGA